MWIDRFWTYNMWHLNKLKAQFMTTKPRSENVTTFGLVSEGVKLYLRVRPADFKKFAAVFICLSHAKTSHILWLSLSLFYSPFPSASSFPQLAYRASLDEVTQVNSISVSPILYKKDRSLSVTSIAFGIRPASAFLVANPRFWKMLAAVSAPCH